LVGARWRPPPPAPPGGGGGAPRRVADLVAAMDTSGVRPGPEGDLLDDAW